MTSKLKSSIKKKIVKNIRLSTFLVASLTLLIILKYLSSSPQLIKSLNFIGIIALILPLLNALEINSASKERFKTSLQLLHSEKKLHQIAFFMIIPMLSAYYRNLSFFKKLIAFIFMFISLLPVLAAHLNLALPIALIIYSFMLIRYIRCLYHIKSFEFSFSHNALTIPVFGLLKHCKKTISFDDITQINLLVSKESVQSIAEDEDHQENNHNDDSSLLGLTLYYHNNDVLIFSKNFVECDFLYDLVDHISKHKGENFEPYIQLISSE